MPSDCVCPGCGGPAPAGRRLCRRCRWVRSRRAGAADPPAALVARLPGRGERVAALAGRAARRAPLFAAGLPAVGEGVG